MSAWINDRASLTFWDIMTTLDIEHLVTALRQLSSGMQNFKEYTERMDLAVIDLVCVAIRKCEKPFRDMGFKTSAGMILKFLDAAQRNQVHADWTGQIFAEKCLAVFSAIQCETIGIICLKLDEEHGRFFDKSHPFGQEVADKLPECSEDIEEAYQCIAFSRYTASMFHIGRAMEHTVKKVAERLQVTPGRDEWQQYLKAINEEINKMPFGKPEERAKRQPIAEISGHLFNFKEAWRNPTFHAKKTYTKEEAIAVMTNAGQFLQYVSKWMSGKT